MTSNPDFGRLLQPAEAWVDELMQRPGWHYEGWHPASRRTGSSRNAFLERISDGLHRDVAVDTEDVARRRPISKVPRRPRREPSTIYGQAE